VAVRTLSLGLMWLALAVAFGLAVQGGDRIVDVPHRLTALGGPWLLLAFAAGVTVRRPWHGALAGAAVLVVATGAYYAVLLGVYGRAAAHYAAVMLVGWGAASALAGAVFGYAGTLWRSRPQAAALPGAALIAEALVLAVEPTFLDAHRLLALEALAGAGLWLVLARRRFLQTMALGLLLVIPLALAADGVRDTLRAAGWAGA
jgi:Family of unknown function (DUF6518)